MSAEAEPRIVTPTIRPGEDDEAPINPLRPRRLSEFVGQDVEKEKLSLAVRASQKRRVALDHLLLSGPPGLGKTTLASIVAAELGSRLVSTSGPALERPADIVGLLVSLEQGDVLFIDEIHRMPRAVEEFLYPAMEDFRIEFTIPGEQGTTVAIKHPIAPFTLIGATTRKGMLTAPLRDRFGLFFDLDFYTVADLCQIVGRSAPLLDMQITRPGAYEVAVRSRGTPRIANRLLKRVRDYTDVHDLACAHSETVVAALAMHGIDRAGLDTLDRRYLSVLIETFHGGPAGVAAIAATMQQERDTLEDVIEPYLLHQGFIIRSPGGRKVTDKAFNHLATKP